MKIISDLFESLANQWSFWLRYFKKVQRQVDWTYFSTLLVSCLFFSFLSLPSIRKIDVKVLVVFALLKYMLDMRVLQMPNKLKQQRSFS